MKTLSLQGDHYHMGLQHGQQVFELRTQILEAMETRLRPLVRRQGTRCAPSLQGVADTIARELEKTWQEIAPSTLAMLQGMAEALTVPFPQLFGYAVASYLDDRRPGAPHTEGCTVWAASRSATRDGLPILTKNRDYAMGHLPLQALAHATPRQGYRYLYITSAGSPAVFSSGMNERGLAVADTYVSSRDIGPGLARYTLMMNLLEQHAQVASALAYLREIPQMGAGNLVLADARGTLAVCENGYRHHGIIHPANDMLVATNHFVSAELRGAYLEGRDGAYADSQARHETVQTALKAAHGGLDAEHVRKLMASHANHGAAICRHRVGEDSGTISNVIFLPAQRQLLVCAGYPCQGTHETFSL